MYIILRRHNATCLTHRSLHYTHSFRLIYNHISFIQLSYALVLKIIIMEYLHTHNDFICVDAILLHVYKVTTSRSYNSPCYHCQKTIPQIIFLSARYVEVPS